MSNRLIGIFGGSFNPVHVGHMMLASYMAQYCGLDEVWLTLSPRNPLKPSDELIDDKHRLEMLQLAIAGQSAVKVCDIELSMPRPSYTIDTLRELSRIYPDYGFKLIIGSDNWLIFDRWREHEAILNEYGVIIYPRPGCQAVVVDDRAVMVDAPQIELSSTFLRQGLSEGKDMGSFMPQGVYRYIKENKLYNIRTVD